MPITPVEFASLLCSRLCHDLLSPVGAITNGLELLADETDPAMRERCMALLAESARVSAAKLKFFRLAFGAAGGFGERIDAGELRSAIEGLFGGDARRVELGWLVAEDALPKPAAKVLLNLALIVGEGLVRGGRLDVGAEEERGAIEIVVRGEGPRIVLDAEVRRTLEAGVADEVTPRIAGAWLVRTLVAEAGGTLLVEAADDGVLLFGATLKG